MQQRQLRLGDILDDYCPRERRVTNHVVVAMIGEDVKQTRCTTCDADHAYKHAKVPRQRKKDTPALLYAQVLAGGPKRVAHEDAQEEEAVTPSNGAGPAPAAPEPPPPDVVAAGPPPLPPGPSGQGAPPGPGAQTGSEPDLDLDVDNAEDDDRGNVEEGPAHRRLIRATLPRIEGQPPPTRPAPDFTIRQPSSRQGRFRPRHQQGASPFRNDNRGNMGGGGGMRQGGGSGRPPMMSRSGKRHGPHGGRKRSK